jgi:hypothetical protein
MREIYKAGGFGKLIYTEGEYYHYMDKHIGSTRMARGLAAAVLFDPLERLLHLRHRRFVHRGLLSGHAEPAGR